MSNTSPVSISIETKNFIVLSSLGSNIPITAAFVLLVIYLNLSILDSRILIFKWIRCSPLLLKAGHSSCLNNWGLLKKPRFKLKSPQSRSNKGQNEVSILNLNLDTEKIFTSHWRCEVSTSFVISIVSLVKTEN